MKTVFIVAMLITIASIPLNIAIEFAMDIIKSDVKPALSNIRTENPSPSFSSALNIPEQKMFIYDQLLEDIKQHRTQLEEYGDLQALRLLDQHWKYLLLLFFIMQLIYIFFVIHNSLSEDGDFLALISIHKGVRHVNQNWALQRIESTLRDTSTIVHSGLNKTNFNGVLIRSLVNDVLHGNDALINTFNSKTKEE